MVVVEASGFDAVSRYLFTSLCASETKGNALRAYVSRLFCTNSVIESSFSPGPDFPGDRKPCVAYDSRPAEATKDPVIEGISSFSIIQFVGFLDLLVDYCRTVIKEGKPLHLPSS